jgi:hypothetical protein
VIKEFPAGKQVIFFVNRLRKTRLIIDKKQKRRCRLLIEEKLDATGARLEHNT